MGRQARILFVDDECNVLQALKRVFLGCDYDILTACSGEEGLDLLRTEPQVQLVVSDYRMPDMNGVEFLAKVLECRPDTITMVLSGYSDAATMVEAINEGHIYRFISKPWIDHDLRVIVADALEIFAARSRNVALAEELRLKNQGLYELNAHLEQLVVHQSNELLLKQRALLHAKNVLERLPVGVISLNPDGVVQQINLEAAFLLGVEPDRMLGKSLSEGGASAVCLPATADSVEACMDRVIELRGTKLRIRGGPVVEEGEAWTVLTMETIDRH